MTTRREFLSAIGSAAACSLLAGRGLRAENPQPQVGDIAAAAGRMLTGLTEEQRGKVVYPVADAERFNWHFVPLNDTKTRTSTRKGICLDDMPAASRAAAMELVKSATSPDGYKWCQQIMEREAVLAELEPDNAWFRKPGWYFFTVFGKPSPTGRWGWRVDGHHLSISVALDEGKIVSATPMFLGVNPVTIKYGKRNGERDTITDSEDLARELFRSLDADQRKIVTLSDHLPEVAGKTVAAPDKLPVGLPAAKMNGKQQEKLLALINHYTGRMPTTLAKIETDKLHKAGLEKIAFAYSGESEPGKRHTYNLQGPSLFIHYMNEMTDPQKNPANHIHSVFRSLSNDFGGAKA